MTGGEQGVRIFKGILVGLCIAGAFWAIVIGAAGHLLGWW